MKTFTTEMISDISRRYQLGEKIGRADIIWHHNIKFVRKCGIYFIYTNNELTEYSKCYNEPLYFIEKYCKKLDVETGKISQIVLRDYQKNIINFYKDNRFQIFLSSRQMGISLILTSLFLHYLTFNENKNVVMFFNKNKNSQEFMDKIKQLYMNLPFFLKKSVINWNQNIINFENGCTIRSYTKNNELITNKSKFGNNTIDVVYYDEMSRYSDEIIKDIYTDLIPTISSKEDSKIIISSQPNGYNFFYDLVQNSELPPEQCKKRNMFKTMRTYWWQIPGRDDKWKQDVIKMLGSDKLFDQEYNLYF